MARPYRPSGRSPPGALPLLLAGCMTVGAALGVAEAVIGHYLISLFILFPALIGLVVGGYAEWGAGRLRIRAPVLAAAVASLGAATGSLAVHFMDYQFFRIQAGHNVRTADPEADPAAAMEGYLRKETGSGGWAGFIRLRAKQGITVKRAVDRGYRISGLGAYALWCVELLVAAGAAAYMAFSREPFCERCQAWYDRDRVLGVGSGDPMAWKAMAAAFDRGDLTGALAVRGAPDGGRRSMLRLQACSRCQQHEPLLRLRVTTNLGTKKQKERVVYETLLRYDQAQALLEKTASDPEAYQAGMAGELAPLRSGERRRR